MRSADFARKTRETNIELSLSLDGGSVEISTGIGFFDHMLTAFAVHGGFGLNLSCDGDLEVDMHHTVEDVGISLGRAFAEAVGNKAGIARFGTSFVPMDEALCRAVADVSGRPFLVFDDNGLGNKYMPGFDGALVVEFLRAFATNAGITLHVAILYGDNAHHCAEAVFKSVARACRDAVRITGGGVLSTKGVL